MSQAPGTAAAAGLAGAAGVGIAETLAGGADAMSNIVATLATLSRNPIVGGLALRRIGDMIQQHIVDRLVTVNKLTGASEEAFRKQAVGMMAAGRTASFYAGAIAAVTLRLMDMKDQQEKLAISQTRFMDMNTLKKGYEGRLAFSKEYMRKELDLQGDYGEEFEKITMRNYERLNRRLSRTGALPGSAVPVEVGKMNLLKVITGLSQLTGTDIGSMGEQFTDTMKASGASVASTTDMFVKMFSVLSQTEDLEDISAFFENLPRQVDELSKRGEKLPEIFARTLSGARALSQAGVSLREAGGVQTFSNQFSPTNFQSMIGLHRAASMTKVTGQDYAGFATSWYKMTEAQKYETLRKIAVREMAPTAAKRKILADQGVEALAASDPRFDYAARVRLNATVKFDERTLNNLLLAKEIKESQDNKFSLLRKTMEGATGKDVLEKGLNIFGAGADKDFKKASTLQEKIGAGLNRFPLVVSDRLGPNLDPGADLLGILGIAGTSAYLGSKALSTRWGKLAVAAAMKLFRGEKVPGALINSRTMRPFAEEVSESTGMLGRVAKTVPWLAKAGKIASTKVAPLIAPGIEAYRMSQGENRIADLGAELMNAGLYFVPGATPFAVANSAAGVASAMYGERHDFGTNSMRGLRSMLARTRENKDNWTTEKSVDLPSMFDDTVGPDVMGRVRDPFAGINYYSDKNLSAGEKKEEEAKQKVELTVKFVAPNGGVMGVSTLTGDIVNTIIDVSKIIYGGIGGEP